ncbi:hypothetical protein apy_03110 [Aeropyrum pernix]|uniref:Uncharacterized protein n=1 Tax=Aeropyrum pernix TaxID=56636 RepID=A0A401H7Z6_AERPX|nr:hypothetical protein [Aeropyrum pernix]GBF08586.1 hypothetical protein apy_03110 [Aeropyrum pernix]
MKNRPALTLLLAILLLATGPAHYTKAGEGLTLNLPGGVTTLELPGGRGLVYSPQDLVYRESYRTPLPGGLTAIILASSGLEIDVEKGDGVLRLRTTPPGGCEGLTPDVHAYLGSLGVREIALGYARVYCRGGAAEVLLDLEGMLKLVQPGPGEIMAATITLSPGNAILLITLEERQDEATAAGTAEGDAGEPGVVAREGREAGLPWGLGKLALLAMAGAAALLGAILEGLHPRLRGGCP